VTRLAPGQLRMLAASAGGRRPSAHAHSVRRCSEVTAWPRHVLAASQCAAHWPAARAGAVGSWDAVAALTAAHARSIDRCNTVSASSATRACCVGICNAMVSSPAARLHTSAGGRRWPSGQLTCSLLRNVRHTGQQRVLATRAPPHQLRMLTTSAGATLSLPHQLRALAASQCAAHPAASPGSAPPHPPPPLPLPVCRTVWCRCPWWVAW
jgi:hypothetical protein